jgi:hypothetical protein
MARNLPSLVVSAVSTWDGKALGKGSKQISAFEKGLKRAGGTLAAAFSAQAIINFGKEAAKAFIEDDKAARQLAKSVENLGLAFETPRIERFISEMSLASGVADDQLRPSMQKLLQTTGSVIKSQELLTQALDISRGSGVEYETVVSDLSAAYLGNAKGLSKYSLGLTKAELNTMSFAKIQEKLNLQFRGANADYLESYAGKIEILTNAAGEAKETIGKGLVDALSLLSGNGDTITPLADSMQKFADNTSDAIYGVGILIDKLKKLPGVSAYLKNVYPKILEMNTLTKLSKDIFNYLQKAGSEARNLYPEVGYYGSMPVGIYPTAAELAKQRKAEEDRLKREKQLAAEKAKNAKAEKQKIALTKAAAVFDTTRIGLAAALKATYDKETKLRLEALMLIEEDKGDEALKKIDELAKFQKNADMERLAGVTTISNATLESLNKQLLTELGVINGSKMAEADKELAREDAFKKYNAAIATAGTLMAKEAYNERVQIQLTEIARLASISKTTSAGTTANLLLESAELTRIERVAKAQAEADAKRLADLKQYLGLLNAKDPLIGTPVPNFTPPSWAKPGGPSTTMGPFAIAREELPTGVMGGGAAGGGSSSSVDITINTGVGDPEAIARAVEDILNQSSYRGTSVNRGSGVYAI